MAYLVYCRICGGKVSSEAKPPCPHCKDPYITDDAVKKAKNAARELQEYVAKKELQEQRWKNEGKCGRCGNNEAYYGNYGKRCAKCNNVM